MGRKRCFVPVKLVDIDVPVPRASVWYREHCHFSKAVDAFFHATKGVRVAYGNGVQLPVVDVGSKQAVLLCCVYNWCFSLRSRRFSDVFGNHLINPRSENGFPIGSVRYEAV